MEAKGCNPVGVDGKLIICYPRETPPPGLFSRSSCERCLWGMGSSVRFAVAALAAGPPTLSPFRCTTTRVSDARPATSGWALFLTRAGLTSAPSSSSASSCSPTAGLDRAVEKAHRPGSLSPTCSRCWRVPAAVRCDDRRLRDNSSPPSRLSPTPLVRFFALRRRLNSGPPRILAVWTHTGMII